jgi:hypothetical protein
MRRLLLSLVLALSLSAVGASSALAAAPEGAQKAPLYGPLDPTLSCLTGGAPTPETFGFAVLNTPGNEMTLTGEVALQHAAPNAEYVVEDKQSSSVFCGSNDVGTIMTNKNGNGNLHFTDERSPLATNFFVVVTNRVTEVFTSPAVELD